MRRSAGFTAEDVCLFGALLGIPCQLPLGLKGSEERRKRTLRGLVRQLKGLAQHLPVLCVFEDLHWADPSTLDVLSSIVEQATGSPIMLLTTYRPEFSCPWVGRARVILERENAPKEVIASHYDQAGQVDEAVHNWHMAARQAALESAHHEAFVHLNSALRHFPGQAGEPQREPRECDLQIDLARNFANLDRFDDAFNALERAEHLA